MDRSSDVTDRMSCITNLMPMKPITEQSTVTVLVATSLCCCLLVLAALAVALGYIFLLSWGVYILEDNDDAASGSCDTYVLWEFCFVNEFYGLLVVTCGCFEFSRVYRNFASDEEVFTKQIDGMLRMRYGVIFLTALVFFVWGCIEWFRISDECLSTYHNKYNSLLLLFRTGVVADGLVAVLALVLYAVQVGQVVAKPGLEMERAGPIANTSANDHGREDAPLIVNRRDS